MDCTEYLSLFSDYYDGAGDDELRDRMDAHRSSCASCRRYTEVVDRGVQALRELSRAEVPADFRPRLRHRLYHVADEEVLNRPSVASGVRGVVALAVAVLFAVAAWSPALRDPEPEVSLPPIVVSEAPVRSPAFRVSPSRFFGSEVTDLRRGAGAAWGGRDDAFYAGPGLNPAYVRTTLFRTGLD